MRDESASGEALADVILLGRQWAVTTFGVECRDGKYQIRKAQLRQDFAAGYSLIAHMSEKAWVDTADFAAIYFAACAIHGVSLSAAEVEMLTRHAKKNRREGPNPRYQGRLGKSDSTIIASVREVLDNGCDEYC